jgi:hypothetical protein
MQLKNPHVAKILSQTQYGNKRGKSQSPGKHGGIFLPIEEAAQYLEAMHRMQQ